LTVIGGNLYFRADDGVNGTELWKSDGTPAGTAMVKDINTAPGEGSQRTHPSLAGADLTHPFAAIGGTIFFEANDGVHGKELWKTDGTSAGTSMVSDINPSDGSGAILNLITSGGALFFTNRAPDTHVELWKATIEGAPAVVPPAGTPPPAGPSDRDGDGKPDAEDLCPDQAGTGLDGCPPVPPGPTAGNDVLNGTAAGETICGLAGDDRLNGLAGNDTLWGDACGAKAKPVTSAASGSGGNDTLNGGAGNDHLYGAGGNDVLNGGKGNDKLVGGSGNDKLTGGPGTNAYSGGAGSDTINARNGKRETVDCGPGKKDKATVDRRDKVKGCEKVKRAKK
jgi:ELWxxDGT repeat protein